MLNLEKLTDVLTRLANCQPTIDHAKLTLQLLDLTRLNPNDSVSDIIKLTYQANELPISISAICVYPQFLPVVIENCKTPPLFKFATVVNFPKGTQPLTSTLEQIKSAIDHGAQEIDMVFPYQNYLTGKQNEAIDYVKQCKFICGETIILKVILECGMFDDLEMLYQASCEVIAAGANFIKTSTGKIAIGASLESAFIMLTAIKNMHDHGYNAGFKASAGIKTVRQALQYITLAQEILGPNWVSPQHMRIGASSIIYDIMHYLGENAH